MPPFEPTIRIAVAGGWGLDYIARMNWLTKAEQRVLCAVLGLLLTGLFVKFYLAAHPAAALLQPVKP